MVKIPGFKLYQNKKNACHYGYLYQRTIMLPFSKYPKRTLHVWVPEDYDGKKRYGVIYCADAQNMVDKYQTLYGEWNMEDHIHERMKKGQKGYIIAGLSCAFDGTERMREYSPFSPTNKQFLKDSKFKRTFGKRYADYMINNIKPMIDRNFKTLPKMNGFLGSSMGGLISSYIGYKYPEVFKFIIAYSPAFFLYQKSEIKEVFEKWQPKMENSPVFVFYMGKGDPLERRLFPLADYVVKQFKKYHFDDTHLYYSVQEKDIHHEKAWSKEMRRTLKYLASVGY